MTRETIDQQTIRLDIWLWAARFFRTRALAKQAIEGGKVKLGGARAKPAKLLRVGEHVEVTRGQDHYELEVVALAAQRGSATGQRG